MKKMFLAACGLVLLSFRLSYRGSDDLWKQLGISQKEGTEKIRNSFMFGYFEHYGIRNVKQLAAGNRAAIARDLLAYARQYVSSDAFKKDYVNEKNQARPQEPEKMTRTKEDIRREKVEEMKKSIKGAEETIKAMPTMEKNLRPTIDLFHKTLKDYQDPNSQMIENMYQYEVYSHNEKVNRYKEDLRKWEEEFPDDYRPRIRKSLEKYLNLAATVDFDAALTEKYGKKVFTNPAYESKPDDWKQIFRAGREVYEVTRPFAEQWLRELK